MPGMFQWYKWWKCPHTPATSTPIRMIPTHINWLIASQTRFTTLFQPAKAEIWAERKNMDIKAIPEKKTELCSQLVQKRVWNSSSFMKMNNKLNTPKAIPPISSRFVLFSNTNCVFRFISWFRSKPECFVFNCIVFNQKLAGIIGLAVVAWHIWEPEQARLLRQRLASQHC